MPTVPQYNRQVAPRTTPTPYNDIKTTGDMFGSNIAQATGNLGQAMGEVGETIVDFKNKIDETKILEMANLRSQWEQENLYDKDKGYYYKVGKDAYGQTEAIMKSYDDTIDDYIEKAGFSPVNRVRAKSSAAKMRENIARGVNQYDFQQGVKWADSEAATAQQNYINNAVNMRNNPDEIGKALSSGYQIIDWKGNLQHKDAASIKADKEQFQSQLHEAVLSTLLGEGSLKASDYFAKHKTEISAEKLPQYVNAVKDNELSYTARTTAQGLLGLSMEDAYAKINAISDPQTRNAVEREYSRFSSQKDAIQTAKNNEFMSSMSNELADMLAGGNDPNAIKIKIMQSDLPFEVKQKQIGFINDCMELNQEVNLWNETEYLENLRTTDFEAFQKVDLSKFSLTKAERQKYLGEQKKVVDYSSEKQLREIVKHFDTFFMPGKNSLDSNVYRDELVGLLARVERLQGDAFDIKNIDEGSLKNIVAGFGYKNDIIANKNIDETKELYMRAKTVADIQGRVARDYVKFKSTNKREPEPAEMFNMVQKIYNDVGREAKAKRQNAVNNKSQIYREINSTKVQKVGYTKVLTHFEGSTIPRLERATGVKMKITSTYRPNAKYGHEKGIKADVFPAVASKSNILKSCEYLIKSPDVKIIFTSNPAVLGRYGTNPKVHDARKYDASPEAKKAGINHITHFDITLSSDFGGTQQIKPATITNHKPVMTAKK